MALVSGNYSLKAVFLVLMPVLLYLAGAYSKGKTCIILRKYCIHYKIQMHCTWENRFQIIKELQAIKVSEFLAQYPFITIEKVNLIIESLRFECAKPQYEYKFINIFSVLFSVIAGAFLAAIVAIPSLLNTWSGVISFFKPIVGFALMFVMFTWFFEAMLLKDLSRLSTNKYGRLIRILENRLITS
ncbi:hypothetical protein ACWKWU_21920 [Chitinophaga lutea]